MTEVMDVKALIINDVLYTDRTVSAPIEIIDGVTRTTYTFSGTANNPVYGAHQLSDISIYVDRDSAGLETIHVDIPAALIPLRLTNILQNSDGQVISYTSNSVFPFRLVYSVGLQDGVLNDDGSVNISNVSSQYIAENTVDGRVRFYEGQFSGNPESGTVGNLGRTIGDACVTYTPALDNPFYYVEEDTPLYVLQDGIDAGGIGAIDEQVLKPASGEFDPDQTYYFQIQYYEATGSGTVPAAVKVARWVARPGASIRETSIGHDPITGALFLREGEPRLGNLNDFLREKGDDNRTDTAQVYLYLSHVDPNLPGNENSYHSFEVYHGNNGLLSASLPNGTLAVTKEVVNGDSAAQEEFQFQITLDEPSEGDLSSSDSVTWAGNIGTFTLANGETMTFTFGQDHTNGIGWCVQEVPPPAEEAQNWDVSVEATGSTASQDGMSASGTLFPSGSAAVTFTNTYITPTGTLTVRKEVTGDVIEADVSTFAFHLHLEEATGDPVTGGVMSAGQEVPLDVNGNYTFTLTSEQSRSFTVPAGTAWTVTETTDLSGSWETTANGRDGNVASGSIKQGETEAVLFTNRYTAPGILIVSKTATGGSGSEQFAFTLSHDGTQERFTLPSGGTRSFILPAGTVYTVAEIAHGEGWSTTVNGLSGSSFSGTVSAGQTTTAAFENTYSQTGTTDPSPGNGGSGGGGNQTHILRFQSNGGTAFADLERNSPFTVNPYDGHIPVRTGYVFTGWYQEAGLVNRISGEIQVTGIRTIYAGWQAATVPSMLNGQDHYAYVIGYADGSVRPYANITRAQVATIFFRLLDEEARQEYLTTTNSFPDVDESYWANTAISTMARLGVIYGRNSGLFDPNAPITRAEFAAICSRFDAGAVTGQSSLTDISGHWAEAEIERAVALGWVQGFTDGTFRPNQNITRAQAVTMINRVLCRLPEESGDLLDGMNTWTDCHKGDWYYLAMQEATNSHDFRHKAGGIHERWVVLREDPDWKQYEA